MRNVCRLAAAVAGAMGAIVPCAQAAWLTVGTPVQVGAGWARIAGRYEAADAEPAFQAIARCGPGGAQTHVLEGRVHLAPEDGAIWVDLPGSPDRLVPSAVPCDAPEVSVEMLAGTTVVASARVPQPDARVKDAPVAFVAPPPIPAKPARGLMLGGQKYRAPFTNRTEAGVSWRIDSRVSIQLNYERTAQPPMMAFDHDDGILTRLRVGF